MNTIKDINIQRILNENSNNASSQFVDSQEMNEISSDKELVENLMNGLEDFKNGDYKIV